MPFHKGMPKVSGSGRKKGEPGKLAKDVATRLESMGCDPIAGLARIAMATEKSEPAVSAHCYSKLANKVYPDRKAVEHTGLGGEAIQLDVSFKQALTDRVLGAAARLGTASGTRQPH